MNSRCSKRRWSNGSRWICFRIESPDQGQGIRDWSRICLTGKRWGSCPVTPHSQAVDRQLGGRGGSFCSRNERRVWRTRQHSLDYSHSGFSCTTWSVKLHVPNQDGVYKAKNACPVGPNLPDETREVGQRWAKDRTQRQSDCRCFFTGQHWFSFSARPLPSKRPVAYDRVPCKLEIPVDQILRWSNPRVSEGLYFRRGSAGGGKR